MQEWVSVARQGFFLNLCRPYLIYSSSVPSILLQLILDYFRGLMEKKPFLVGGAPVSLDYAEFLGTSFGWTFSFVLYLDRFTILCRCFSEYISFATYFLLLPILLLISCRNKFAYEIIGSHTSDLIVPQRQPTKQAGSKS